MNAPPGGGRTRLWKRVAWVVAVSALLLAVIGIYLFLRPEPRRLADPEEFSLAAGERFSLDGLPMGGRYRLRACTSPADLQASVGTWRSGATRLEPNPTDNPALDLRVDGRAGGTLAIEAQSATGRMLLFRERVEVTCRSDAPLDTGYRAQQLANALPPFKCDDERLAVYDRTALMTLRAELQALERGAGANKAVPTATDGGLSAEQRACLGRIDQRLSPSGSPSSPASPVPPAGAPTGETAPESTGVSPSPDP